jgi:hypothetical protein
LSVGHAKIFCDFFASMASFRQNLAELSANSVDNSVNSAEFHISKNFMVLSHVSCNSTEFSRFSPIFFSNFAKCDGFAKARISLSRRTL